MPKDQPLEPADLKAIKAMLRVCRNNFTGRRDKAIILMLLDTGIRASELIALELENVNPIIGVVQILHGKGNKFRTVYLGRKSRIALRRYLSVRGQGIALFINIYGERLTYSGLRLLLQRRAKKAGVPYQSPHSFRRLFVLEMLRNGADIFSLQLLMGHTDVQVLRRYLKQSNRDVQQVHVRAGPADNLGL